MGLVLIVIGYFLAIVVSAVCMFAANTLKIFATQKELVVFCVVLVFVAEWICLAAFKMPLLFLGKKKEKEEFESYLAQNFVGGRSFSEIKEQYERKVRAEKLKWGLSCGKKGVTLSAFFLRRPGVLIFLRNRCNNLRTILFIAYIVYFCISMPELVGGIYMLAIVFILYAWLMGCFAYGLGPIGSLLTEFTSINAKDSYDMEKELKEKTQFEKSRYICLDCGKMIEFYNERIEYETKPDFDGYTTSKTTYKEARIGEIRIGNDSDDKIKIYGNVKDKTTVTAYGYQSWGCFCPYCKKRQGEDSRRLESSRTYSYV